MRKTKTERGESCSRLQNRMAEPKLDATIVNPQKGTSKTLLELTCRKHSYKI